MILNDQIIGADLILINLTELQDEAKTLMGQHFKTMLKYFYDLMSKTANYTKECILSFLIVFEFNC